MLHFDQRKKLEELPDNCQFADVSETIAPQDHNLSAVTETVDPGGSQEGIAKESGPFSRRTIAGQ